MQHEQARGYNGYALHPETRFGKGMSHKCLKASENLLEQSLPYELSTNLQLKNGLPNMLALFY